MIVFEDMTPPLFEFVGAGGGSWGPYRLSGTDRRVADFP